MGLENCQIYLDKPSAIYFPGETVSGRVEFNFNSPKKVRGIEIKFKGQAKVHWSESETRSRNGKSESRTVYFDADESYFNIINFILGGPNHESMEIPSGTHVYNIMCVLPPVLPSSFEGDYGFVRYTVKATLVRPWKFDQTIKAAFTVIAQHDLNLSPRCREPATLTMEKHFCCLFCKSGPLTGILKVPCTGFVSGQTIPMTLEVDNASNVDVTDVKVKLKKIVKYHAKTPYHKTRSGDVTIAEIKFEFDIKGKETGTRNLSMVVPSLPASALQNCSIMDIDYEIRITIGVAGMHANLDGYLPITIGTIPLINMVPMPVPQHSINVNIANQQPIIGWMPAPPNTPPIDPALMPPPSYEECQFGAKTILEDDDSKDTRFNNAPNWAPSYPVYNFNFSPSAPSTSFDPANPTAPEKE